MFLLLYNSGDQIKAKKEFNTYKVNTSWSISKEVFNISVQEKKFQYFIEQKYTNCSLGSWSSLTKKKSRVEWFVLSFPTNARPWDMGHDRNITSRSAFLEAHKLVYFIT